ncbi:DNA helicase UvrD [Pseudoalteromonas ruthenica]|uniref:DNA helicase UvrD n=1 Tax=Pseudoalteromonas ruthenica TaxID=151081 RepID=UPI00110B1171|nr:DNA helicase UvrD [Pseudoalteromonas ruthenica]TMP23787.1 DNA helicase UvrD [Pseudoalteromonas ruthenica]
MAKQYKPWWKRVLLAIDQLGNVVLLNGHEDHTISGRVGYFAHTTTKRRWKLAQGLINGLFFWDKNHCYNSIEWDRVGEYEQAPSAPGGPAAQ